MEASLRGVGRSIRNFHDRQKDMKINPLRHVRGFIEEAREDLGVDEEQYFNISDLHKTVGFGWQKGLHRCFVMMLEILKLQLKEEHLQAAALNTQCLRAIRQAVIDNGKWKTAWNLTYLPDPLSKRRFGGTPQDLEVIAQLEKSLDDIEKRSKLAEEEDTGQQDWKKAWWKRQGGQDGARPGKKEGEAEKPKGDQ